MEIVGAITELIILLFFVIFSWRISKMHKFKTVLLRCEFNFIQFCIDNKVKIRSEYLPYFNSSDDFKILFGILKINSTNYPETEEARQVFQAWPNFENLPLKEKETTS